MKNINRYIALAVFGGMLVFNSCETTELDITQDPNALTPDQASIDFFLSSIQEDFVRQFDGDADYDANDNWQSGGATTGDGFNLHGMELTRMMNMFGRSYPAVYQPGDMDDEWTNGYRGILSDIRAMTPLAEAEGLTHHIGIAQFIEAYLMVTMVDYFGDVPYSEAVRADEGIFNPVVDPGADIYAAALSLLDNAIANFNSNAIADPAEEFFYNNDYEKWVRAANTLKLKIYLQTRLVDGSAAASFNAIINSGNYIQDTADDFQWAWPGTSNTQPDTRHPYYGLNYQTTGGQHYQSNWYMNLINELDDPRRRYYFYRQSEFVPGAEIDPDEVALNCSLQPAPQHYIDGGFTFCFLPNGYWGRDHGDAEGIPPDGLSRTVVGVYPAGGRFDDSSFEAIAPGDGGGGRGITLLLSAFGVDLMRAEFAMAAGNFPAGRDFMLDAFDKQMTKVDAFLAGREGTADVSLAPSDADIAAYRATISAAFDAASNEGKWDIFAEQYFITHWGNGVEPYNFYRRTLYPTTLQPNREPNPGTFVMSMYYPSDAVNTNSNISQKADQTQPVFWDNSGVPPAN